MRNHQLKFIITGIVIFITVALIPLSYPTIKEYRQLTSKIARELLIRAKLGKTSSALNLGLYYLYMQHDYVHAAPWLGRAVKLADPEGLFALGSLYESGSGVEKDLPKAIKLYEQALAQGQARAGAKEEPINNITAGIIISGVVVNYTSAANNLGVIYEKGKDGVAADQDAALKYYKLAVELKNPIGKFNLARCYLYGLGVEKQPQLAVDYLKESAAEHYIDAQLFLAALYEEGTVIDKNVSLSFKMYKDLAHKGYPEAQFRLGRYYFNGVLVGQDYTQAEHWFGLAQEQNYIPAIYALAKMHEDGLATDSDPALALKYYQQLAEKDDGISMYELGRCYYMGIGTDKDLGLALEWFTKALTHDCQGLEDQLFSELYAKALEDQTTAPLICKFFQQVSQTEQYPNAWYYLGHIYFIGLNPNSEATPENSKEAAGTEALRDYAQALVWYNKAAEHKVAGALYQLGYMYDYGLGTKTNKIQAFKYYQQAAELDMAVARYSLAICYLYGIGTKANVKQGLAQLEKLAQDGEANAQNHLASLYFDGVFVKKNILKSYELLQQAATTNKDAQINLGFLYENGIHVARDLTQALHWYKLAAAQKDDKAVAKVKELETLVAQKS